DDVSRFLLNVPIGDGLTFGPLPVSSKGDMVDPSTDREIQSKKKLFVFRVG
ncbi:hypothetical protein L195_g029255, partial [Trifolium pratense]